MFVCTHRWYVCSKTMTYTTLPKWRFSEDWIILVRVVNIVSIKSCFFHTSTLNNQLFPLSKWSLTSHRVTYCWVLHQIEHYGFISGKLWGYPTLQNRRAYKIHLIKHIYHIWPALLKYPNQLYMGAACKRSVSLFSLDSAAGFVCVFVFFSFCWFDRKADSVRLNNALHHQVYQFVFYLSFDCFSN